MHQMNNTFVQGLQDICLEVISSHDYWIVQKRHVQYLPEHVANQLLQLLLMKGRLHSPSLLDTFRHAVTRLNINTKQHKLQLGAEWTAYIAGLSNLQQLSLQHASRLKDKQLMPLTRLTGSLTALDLSGCGNITNKACAQVISSLTALQSLNLTGTGIRPPILVHFTQLTSLTHLNLGGCEVSDDDITCHMTVFKHLKSLDLWGSGITDVSVSSLDKLPSLQHLSIAWSQIRSAIPLHHSVTCLDLSHCQLEGSWQEADGLIAAADGMKLQELLLVHTHAPAAYADVLEAVLRSSSTSLRLLDLTAFNGCDLLPLLLALQTSTTLHSLSLSQTGLVDDYCPALNPCTALQNLDLSQNPGVTTAGLDMTLPGLTGLRRLNLRATGITDDCLEALRQLPALQELVLAGTAVNWESRGPQTAAAAAAGASEAGPLQQGSGSRSWQSLQVLDLLNTGISDAGCVQLAQSLCGLPTRTPGHGTSEPTSSAVDHSRSGSSSGGGCDDGIQPISHTAEAVVDGTQPQTGVSLRVLSIGSSRISRKGLAAISFITSLQRLTLQGCQIQDRDLRVLSSQHQLQQLHVNSTDPWLLSDEALRDLPSSQQLAQLSLVTRDGRLLHTTAEAGTAQAAYASEAVWAQDAHEGQQQSWLKQAVAVGSDQPWIYSNQLSATSSRWDEATATPAGMSSHSPSHSNRKKALGSAKGGSTPLLNSNAPAGAETVYRRLWNYDERYRYSTQQLMAIGAKVNLCAAAGNDGDLQQKGQHPNRPDDCWVWDGLQCIPEDLRAGNNDKR